MDLRGLWRRDGTCTLRQIAVRVRFLPAGCAIAEVQGETVRGWGTTQHLIADAVEALSGQPHPARPVAKDRKRVTASMRRKLRAQQARQRRRRERLHAGQHERQQADQPDQHEARPPDTATGPDT